MTLDHLNTTPMPPDQPPEDGLPMDSPPETSGEPPKKKRPWLLHAILAAATAALVIGAAVWIGVGNALPHPDEAACKAVDSLRSLPDPVTLGVLGQGEVNGLRFGVSGNLNLQTDEDGLALSLTDCTLGYEEGSVDLEVNINREAAALRLPELSEGWYGVDLGKALKGQAAESVGEELADWYFTPEQLEEGQQVMDELRAALAGVRVLGLSEEDRTAIKEFIQTQGTALWKENRGYGLSLTVPPADMNALLEQLGLPQMELSSPLTPLDEPGNVLIRGSLDWECRLLSLDVTADDFLFSLDLGDVYEPSPRLELTWGEDKENSLELAFIVSEGAAVEMPDFQNVFALLTVLAEAGE